MSSKGEKKKRDKEDLSALHNGHGDSELGFVAVWPPQSWQHILLLLPQLCTKPWHGEEKVSGLFCNRLLPFCRLHVFVTLSINAFLLPYSKPAGPFLPCAPWMWPHNHVRTQAAVSPLRQIFFRGTVRFRNQDVGGWLFSQRGKFAQGPGCAAAERSRSHGSSQVWLAPLCRAGPATGVGRGM